MHLGAKQFLYLAFKFNMCVDTLWSTVFLLENDGWTVRLSTVFLSETDGWAVRLSTVFLSGNDGSELSCSQLCSYQRMVALNCQVVNCFPIRECQIWIVRLSTVFLSGNDFMTWCVLVMWLIYICIDMILSQ